MLTRREVLIELKRVEIKELSPLKRECRDFEKYVAVKGVIGIQFSFLPSLFTNKSAFQMQFRFRGPKGVELGLSAGLGVRRGDDF
jgi:hypothetical protein